MSDDAINARRYSAGTATSYGAAVRGGYTGTYAEYCAEQANFAKNAQAVREDREAVEKLKDTFTKTTVPEAVKTINDAAETQVGNVGDAGAAAVRAVNAAGDQQVGRVEQAIDPYVRQAEKAKDDAKNAQSAAEEAQGKAETAAGHAAESEQHAQDLVDSLPSDYAGLLQDVVKLKSDLSGKVFSGTATANVKKYAYFVNNGILYKASAAIASGEAIRPGTNCTAVTVGEILEALSPIRHTVTLAAASWSGKSQDVTVPGVLADETKQMIDIIPADASKDAYISAGVMAASQAENSLTFNCVTVPTADLTVYIIVTEVQSYA